MYLQSLSYLTFDDNSNKLKDGVKSSKYTNGYELYGGSTSVSDNILFLNRSTIIFNRSFSRVNFNLQQYTIDAWYNYQSRGNSNIDIVFSFWYNSNNGIKFCSSGSYYRNGNSINFIKSFPVIGTNQWHRYTLSYNGSDTKYKFRLFIDGVFICYSQDTAYNLIFFFNGNDPWVNGGGSCVGYIKNLGIYSTPIISDFNVNTKFYTETKSVFDNDGNLYIV